jgi:hypothetical protein
MLRYALKRLPLKRVAPGVPLVWALLAGEIALMAADHLSRLNAAQRRRLLALTIRSRGRPSSLSEADRLELRILVAKFEPRLFVGSTVKRLSPVPVPKRLLYGPRAERSHRAS